MANTSEIFSNVSSEVDASTRLSAVETKADVGLVTTSHSTQTLCYRPVLDCNSQHSTRLLINTYRDRAPYDLRFSRIVS
jgi:hypothetical protein